MNTNYYEALGAQAFANGESSAPTLNAEVQTAISNLAVGEGAALIMRAFSSGWHNANLAASAEAQ